MAGLEPLPRLFLHFYDPHFYEARKKATPGHRGTQSPVVAEARLATRIAALAAQEVWLPAASFLEVPDCQKVLAELDELFPTGKFRLVGGGGDLLEYASAKVLQYEMGSARRLSYEAALSDPPVAPGFRTRHSSATRDIKDGWATSDLDKFWKSTTRSIRRFERAWMAVPDELGELAFTPEYTMRALVAHLGLDKSHHVHLGHLIHSHVNAMYFDSFRAEFECGGLRNLTYLEASQSSQRGPDIDFGRARRSLQRSEMLQRVLSATAEDLMELVDHESVVRAVTGALLLPDSGQDRLEIHVQASLFPPPVDAFRNLSPGASNAKRYEQLIQSTLTYAFPLTLGNPRPQEVVDQGRKIIDILYSNLATTGGLMAFARTYYGAVNVIVECKNYSGDPTNPELDQLAGRVRPEFGKFGILVCRTITNLDRLIDRCKDFRRNQGLLLVPLADNDMIALIDSVSHRQTLDAGFVELGVLSNPLARRMLEIHQAL